MRIGLAQINPTIGDLEGNLKTIENVLLQAHKRNVDLCVFPEMSIIGYPPLEQLDQTQFVANNLRSLDRLIPKTKHVAAIVGYARPTPIGMGNRLQNVAALLDRGEIVSTHAKKVLATNDLFDEHRYFDPAESCRVADFRNIKLGICIGEDALGKQDPDWSRAYGNNELDPVADLVEQGAELIINIAAVPFSVGRYTNWTEHLRRVAKQHSRPIIHINQVGVGEGLIFRGNSAAIGPDGSLCSQGVAFSEDSTVFDLDTGVGEIHETIENETATLIQALIHGTGDYAKKRGFETLLIGLTGTIEEAVVSVIAARAVTPDNVYGVALPSRWDCKDSLAHTRALAKHLNIHLQVIGIDDVVQSFIKSLKVATGTPSYHEPDPILLARVRSIVMSALAARDHRLLLNTCSKSDILADLPAARINRGEGLSVLSDVLQTRVIKIAAEMNRHEEAIPLALINPGQGISDTTLRKGQDRLSYTVLDVVFDRLVQQGHTLESIVSEGYKESLVRDIAQRIGKHASSCGQPYPRLIVSTPSQGRTRG
ncbi:MAG: nitrilase-related carbon-nitrogen hydrolase [Myxococcota bacterium]|nr:nitrilase-related carbon-nitrogen hydrolase [Myxococcota bacterium]